VLLCVCLSLFFLLYLRISSLRELLCEFRSSDKNDVMTSQTYPFSREIHTQNAAEMEQNARLQKHVPAYACTSLISATQDVYGITVERENKL
jgi:hypothetical protein